MSIYHVIQSSHRTVPPTLPAAGKTHAFQSRSEAQSPFRYPGGKSKLLRYLYPAIDQMLVGQNGYCDVFVGGGSTLLSTALRHPRIELFANDLDFGIYCFWRAVASPEYRDLIGLVREAEITVERFRHFVALDITNLSPVEAAFARLCLNRTSFSGMGVRPLGGWTQIKNKITSRWNPDRLVRQIEACHRLLAGRLEVTNLHVDEFLATHPHVAPYLDPPYVVAGPELYLTAMTVEEHRTLASTLLDRSNWVLSIDDVPVVHDLYAAANLYRLPASYSIGGKKVKHKETHELLITAQPLALPLPEGMAAV